ncbi:MAG: SUF system NifU family Fe-S cluster assembly protein [Bacilli bacterium]|nr:SUF system NifU family Fe-S cluster assembly protein [Bacilli bacterium]MBR1817252.1 SUF system NifU family Fe-S cluster assembly protein [Bacilli bacterium]
MDEETKRAIIMQHYMQPEHRRDGEEEGYIKVNTANSSCIDNLDIFTDIEDGVIKDIYFHGEACAISTSSVSIMIKNLIGMKVEEALHYIENFENMISEKEYDEEILKEANVYNEIYKQSNRKNCAYLPYRGVKKVLLDYLDKN